MSDGDSPAPNPGDERARRPIAWVVSYKLPRQLKPYSELLRRRWYEAPCGILLGTVAAFITPTFVALWDELFRLWDRIVENHHRLALLVTIWRDAAQLPAHALAITSLVAVAVFLLIRPSVTRFTKGILWAIATDSSPVWIVASYISLLSWNLTIASASLSIALVVTCASYYVELRFSGPGFPRNPDEPIESDDADTLGRKQLVKTLVEKIELENTAVLALTGPYGEGKTSILNLLGNALKRRNVVVLYKAWLPGDESTLVASLFNSIAEELRRSFLMPRLRRILARYAGVLAGLIPNTPGGIKQLFNDPSQEEQVAELQTALARLPVRKVVILLDEMDRMHARELEILLKIIRAAGQYPKVTFVCAFHKAAIARILTGWDTSQDVDLQLSGSGAQLGKASISGELIPDATPTIYEYLEKFFPVQIAVPKIDDGKLANEFEERFRNLCRRYALLGTTEEETAFSKQFESLWETHFKYALSNIRKLNSYFNALNWAFPGVRKEVNLFDFMILELLRQTAPVVYDRLYENRKFYYEPSWAIERWIERFVSEEREKSESSKAYEQVLRGLHGQSRSFATDLLSILFPKFAKYAERKPFARNSTLDEDQARKERKIYHPLYFPIYFTFQVPATYFGSEELEQFIEMINSSDQVETVANNFQQYFQNLQNLKGLRFLERLIASRDKLSEPAAEGVALGIAGESQLLDEDFLGIGNTGAARRLVFVVAQRFENSPRITQFLRTIIDRSATDGFANAILQGCRPSAREKNRIIKVWDHVDVAELDRSFTDRMRHRYYPGTPQSVYGRADNQAALFTWSNSGPEGLKEVHDYLRFEFSARPASIAKHLAWLMPSLQMDSSGLPTVNRLFPLREIEAMIESKRGAIATTEAEEKIVSAFLEFMVDNPGLPGGPTSSA